MTSPLTHSRPGSFSIQPWVFTSHEDSATHTGAEEQRHKLAVFVVTRWLSGCLAHSGFRIFTFCCMVSAYYQPTNIFRSSPTRSSLERPMKIEIVYDPSKPVPLASRVAPAPTPASNGAKAAPRVAAAVRGRRPRGRGGARKTERTPKTAADLDAEMEDYTANNAPAAAT